MPVHEPSVELVPLPVSQRDVVEHQPHSGPIDATHGPHDVKPGHVVGTPHVPLLQASPVMHVPHVPPQPLLPQLCVPHEGMQHWCVEVLHVAPVAHAPHEPPQPLSPHCRPPQFVVQHAPAGVHD